jgi:DMSO/TMAO reductase YedYZ molybdopterin-dependent catalytic subunit
MQSGFDGWRFEVGGLVEQPLSLSLDEMRSVEPERQVTLHKCIQGWSYVAEWEGVPLKALLDRCRTTAEARYILFPTSGKRLDMGSTAASSI